MKIKRKHVSMIFTCAVLVAVLAVSGIYAGAIQEEIPVSSDNIIQIEQLIYELYKKMPIV